MELPPGVHKVHARGRTYFYFQIGRGTPSAGERVRLPDDPRSPEFWAALRQAQGISVKGRTAYTINALIDAYLVSSEYTKRPASTQKQYRRYLQIVRDTWGNLHPDSVEPKHVLALMETLSSTPSKANTVLSVMRIISAFGRARGLIKASLVEGIKPNKSDGGHKPWTPEQIKAAHEQLTGVVRRGVLLYLYTGQRASTS